MSDLIQRLRREAGYQEVELPDMTKEETLPWAAAAELERLRDDRDLEKRWRKDSDERAERLTRELEQEKAYAKGVAQDYMASDAKLFACERHLAETNTQRAEAIYRAERAESDLATARNDLVLAQESGARWLAELEQMRADLKCAETGRDYIRAETIEECARQCDAPCEECCGFGSRDEHGERQCCGMPILRDAMPEEIANRIRALSEPQAKEYGGTCGDLHKRVRP